MNQLPFTLKELLVYGSLIICAFVGVLLFARKVLRNDDRDMEKVFDYLQTDEGKVLTDAMVKEIELRRGKNPHRPPPKKEDTDYDKLIHDLVEKNKR